MVTLDERHIWVGCCIDFVHAVKRGHFELYLELQYELFGGAAGEDVALRIGVPFSNSIESD